MNTTVTLGSRDAFRKGDRALISGRPAVVTHADETTLTIAWRDAWYWRLAWFLSDDWSRTVRDVRRVFRAALLTVTGFARLLLIVGVGCAVEGWLAVATSHTAHALLSFALALLLANEARLEARRIRERAP
jgi:hypothetical protein